MRFLPFILFLSLGWAACSSTGGSQRQGYSQDRITLEEIQKGHFTNAYNLITRLRPQWLKGRGRKSLLYEEEASYPVVYVDNSEFGDLNALRTVSITMIKEIRFLNPGDATNRFGFNHASGAILITSF